MYLASNLLPYCYDLIVQRTGSVLRYCSRDIGVCRSTEYGSEMDPDR